jgi:hypothetical protein
MAWTFFTGSELDTQKEWPLLAGSGNWTKDVSIHFLKIESEELCNEFDTKQIHVKLFYKKTLSKLLTETRQVYLKLEQLQIAESVILLTETWRILRTGTWDDKNKDVHTLVDKLAGKLLGRFMLCIDR